MPKLLAVAVCGLLTAVTASAQPPAGRWRLKVPLDGQSPVLLVNLAQADGKWVGDFLGSFPPLDAEPAVTDVAVAGGAVRFTLAIQGQEFASFDGRVGKDGKTVPGSLAVLGGPARPAELVTSQLKKLSDPFDLAREVATQAEGGAELFDAGFAVLAKAGEKKVPVEEVRGVADKLARAAAAHGPRWERLTALRLATGLSEQPGFAELAIAQARRAERMLADDTPPAVLLETADALGRVMAAAGKPDEAKRYAASVARLETRDASEYLKAALGFTPEAAKPGQGRVALVELFTASEAAPCAAAELAVAAARQAFSPSDLVVLTYHLHAGGPDVLCNPDAIDRVQYYAERQKQPPSVPLLLVNGRPGPKVGGPAGAAKGKFGEVKPPVEAAINNPPACRLTLAVGPGDKSQVARATVADLKEPGDNTVLRFFLAEARVRYAGDSGVRYHQMVVRAAPGGTAGSPLTKGAGEQAVPVDVAGVRAGLAKYLDDFAKAEGKFPRPDRPLALTDLKLVAVVQNDATGEVLAAAQADVK